jgi:hypothetical protein
MTTQQSDEVTFEGVDYELTAVDGTGLFDPAAWGLEPQFMGTHCWRGYICEYGIVEQRLLLRALTVGSEDTPPPLDGVQPRRDDRRGGWHYRGLDVAVEMTGRLLVGAGDVEGRPYLHMGFWPAWLYAEVWELTFRAGALLTATDCSAALAVVRERMVEVGVGPGPGEESGDWVSRTFSLAYDYSWPGRPEA